MKIRYIAPASKAKNPLGDKEIERRQDTLRNWAFQDTYVDMVALSRGPSSLESAYEEYLSIPGTAEEILKAEKEGFDATIVGCYCDPGLDGLREISKSLVVGPGGTSMALAATLGHSFSIITVCQNIIPTLRRLSWEVGVINKLSSIRTIQTSVLEMNEKPNIAQDKIIEAGRLAIQKDDAHVLVLGCMSMGFLGVAEYMMKELGIPVVNPAKCSLKITEALIACGLRSSSISYLKPSSMVDGTNIVDFNSEALTRLGSED